MTEVLLYILGIAVVVVGLAVSIGLHEFGHLIPAKLFGVKVTQYMIGFGKTIFSRTKGDTEYGVKLLPFGGYIAMTGMYPPAKEGGAPREATTGFFSSAVDGAREVSAETVLVGEEHRAFYRLAEWKKIIIMLGGPFMNLVLAFVFFAIVLVGFGVPQSSTTLGAVNECLKPAESTSTTCDAGDAEAPAAAAGLQPGDLLVSVDGKPVETWEGFRSLVAASPGRSLSVVIERDGEQRTVQLTPKANERIVTDKNGNAVNGADGKPETETAGMIGATAASETVRQPITAVPAYVGDNIAAVGNVILHLPQRMVAVWNAAFSSEERDPNGPVGVVGIGRMAGEIVSLDDAPVAAKVQTMLGLLGSLNIALLVFNLVPLMPLDGGHVAGALYEGGKRMWARLRRKPDPGPVDTAKMVPVTMVVVLLLGAMSLLLVYADLVKPVRLFG